MTQVSVKDTPINQTRVPILARIANKVREELIKLAAEEIATDPKLCEDEEFMQTGLYPLAEEIVDTYMGNEKREEIWIKVVEDVVHENKNRDFKLKYSTLGKPTKKQFAH